MFDEGEGKGDAEDAVEGPSVGDGIEVGGDQEPGGGSGAEEGSEIADGVTVDLRTCGLGPLGEEGVDLVHRGGEKGTGGLSGNFRAGSKGLAAGDGLGGELGEGRHAERPRRASMVPWGSSVGTKISLGLSWPKRFRSTRRQCLLGMIMWTSSMA